MKSKLLIEENLTAEKLQSEIDRGAKFVSFQYCISLFLAVTLRRFSPAILVKNEQSAKKYQIKYNFISLIFGWWGIPWGPYYTFKSVALNNKGGLDVTEDIMMNLTEEGLRNKEIEIKKTNQLFCKPDKWNKKAFIKAFSREFERDYNIKQLVVGLFINRDEGVAPYYTIGLRVDQNFDKYVEPLRKAVYTQFRKYVHFEFVDLNVENEVNRLLEKQGEYIINRKSFNYNNE